MQFANWSMSRPQEVALRHVLSVCNASRKCRQFQQDGDVAEIIDEFGDDDLLTLVFEPIAARYPTRTHAFTANGLAG